MYAQIKAIDYYLPAGRLTNIELASAFPEWSIDKISKKTGISERRLAAKDECSSDLAVEAALKLFASGVDPAAIEFVLLCTQSADYFLPTTACLVQERLGIPTTCGALDFNLGCSGYVYGLSLAKGLIETGQVCRVLLLTAETYSKFIGHNDKSVRAIFGDAGSATLLEGTRRADAALAIGPFSFGSDGSGATSLIVKQGGARDYFEHEPELHMNGPEIFNFTLKAVPESLGSVLEKSGETIDDIDLFIFHQANRYMLDHLRMKLGIPHKKFVVDMTDCGNTVSSTIPIALRRAADEGRLCSGMRVLLCGFGVGYSWASTIIRWA